MIDHKLILHKYIACMICETNDTCKLKHAASLPRTICQPYSPEAACRLWASARSSFSFSGDGRALRVGDEDGSSGNVASGLRTTMVARLHTCLIRGPPDASTSLESFAFSGITSPASFLLGRDSGESDDTMRGGEATKYITITNSQYQAQCKNITFQNLVSLLY